MTKAEGIWPCNVLSGFSGDNDKGVLVVRINVQITDGPDKGTFCTYEDEVNAKSALYIGRSCKAVGWKGRDLASLANDVAAWVKATGGVSSVEIRHVPIKKGKKFDEWTAGGCKGPAPVWDKANSIGRGPKPLKAASENSLADANDAMRAAMEADGTAPPPDDDRRDDDRIPF